MAVNAQLQECDAGSILAGSLLGESLGLQPSPQLGQYYLVPFDCKVKGPDGKTIYLTDENGNKIKDSSTLAAHDGKESSVYFGLPRVHPDGA